MTTITFNKASGTASSYQNIYTDGNGGLIYISVVYTLNINIDSSVFKNNTSKQDASHIYIDNTITDALYYIMTNTQVSSS